MTEKIRCPFCNFETPYPVKDKVVECLGECYSTYSLFNKSSDSVRDRMRLVEIFFLDSQSNVHMTPDEVDERCEFAKMDAQDPDHYILFAREKRVDEHEIEKLKHSTELEIELGVDSLERLHSALERFERDMKSGVVDREKLLNEIKVVEKIVKGIRERLELSL